MALLPKVKLKSIVSFPAAVFGGAGVAVRNENGNFYFDVNFATFAPPVGSIPDAANQNALLWNKSTGGYVLAPVSLFGGGGGIPEAPNDGTQYGRQSLGWTPTTGGGLPDAPSDGTLYGRKNAAWAVVRVAASIKDYGALGNGQAVTATVTIASGSPNLTATGAAFAAADVGKLIAVPGAGASGGILSTTILTFTDATHIVLAANAATAVSAVSKSIRYGSNDIAAINAAIAAVNAGTISRISWPRGVYCVNATLTTITGSALFYGDGPQVSILQTFAATGDIMVINGPSTVRDFGWGSAVVRTSGGSIKMTGGGILINNFEILNPYVGIINDVGGVMNFLDNGNINLITSRNVAANSGGVLNMGTVLGATNVRMGSGTAVNADMAEYGFKVLIGELDCTQCYVFQTNAGVHVTPGAGQTVLGVSLKGCWFDTTITSGVNVTPAHATAIVSYIWIDSCWLAPGSNGGVSYALVIDNGIGASLTKTFVSNSYLVSYNNNNGVGVYLNGANLEFSMNGGQIGGQNFGFNYGIQVLANTTKWSFVGVTVSYNVNAINWAAGADSYVFNSNRVQNNGSIGTDSSTPTVWSVLGNIGYDPPWRSYTPSVAAASGSLTGSATGKYQIIGKTVNFLASATISSVGSGTAAVDVGLPYPVNGSFVLFGRDQAFGPALQCVTGVPNASTVRITKVSDNSFPAANGSLLICSGTYERT